MKRRAVWVGAVAVLLWSALASAVDPILPWTGTRTGPGSIYYHGPNQLPWNADSGKYVGWDNGSNGGATARSEYKASIGRMPMTIEGRQTASAASIAKVARGIARFAGPAALAVQVAEIAWDANQGNWNTFDTPAGMQTGGASADLNHCYAAPGNSSWGEDGSACYNEENYGGTCSDQTPPVPAAGFGANGNQQFNHAGGTYCWYTIFWRYPGPWLPPQLQSHTSTDEEMENAIKAGLEANPTAAAQQAQRNETASPGSQVLSQPVQLSGPSTMDAGTSTSTTTGPNGATTTNTQTTYNVTYNQNNVYNQVTTTTTTTDANGTTTTTSTTGPNAPQQEPQPPTECGSLSCESTQQQVKTNTDAIKQSTADTLTELQAASAPPLPPQGPPLAAAKSADKDSMDAAMADINAGVLADQTRWFDWTWASPAGTCTAPTATMSRGVTVRYDYCPMVVNIRAILGWLFALFGSWHVYGVLFRSRDR